MSQFILQKALGSAGAIFLELLLWGPEEVCPLPPGTDSHSPHPTSLQAFDISPFGVESTVDCLNQTLIESYHMPDMATMVTVVEVMI